MLPPYCLHAASCFSFSAFPFWLLCRRILLQSNNKFLYILFLNRIRKGVPSEARVVSRVLPPLLLDFFPAQEIMNKVIGEFLSSQQPHPELMAQVLFKVLSTCYVLVVPFQMTSFLGSDNVLSSRFVGSPPFVLTFMAYSSGV